MKKEEERLEIAEFDDAGNVTATYIQSVSDLSGLARVDVILPKESKSYWQQLLDIFLPAGYPHSVTHDYIEYQIYDSLQAFSSSIAGLLSSRAVLSSVGVGDSTASPTAALMLSILQESVGRVATIVFAHRLGSSLEPECKMYRLLADVLNDLAFVLDCLSPALPKPARIGLLSGSSALRALCGVAAGSAKASLSAHFARAGNLGELNAKDASQETVISLLGLLAGSLVVAAVTSPAATWAVLLALLAVHLETNRRAVRAVCMRSLNRQRATLVFHHLRAGRVPAPEEVARQERIFERDGVLRDGLGRAVGHCAVGVGMGPLLRAVEKGTVTKASGRTSPPLNDIIELYKGRRYMLWNAGNGRPCDLIAVLERDASPTDVLVAWWQSLELAIDAGFRAAVGDFSGGQANGDGLERWRRSLRAAEQMLQTYAVPLKEKGWDLDSAALETRISTRVLVRT